MIAARAAPYEKGTETACRDTHGLPELHAPRARPPMRRGLKPLTRYTLGTVLDEAARAAPYEKGTETSDNAPR